MHRNCAYCSSMCCGICCSGQDRLCALIKPAGRPYQNGLLRDQGCSTSIIFVIHKWLREYHLIRIYGLRFAMITYYHKKTNIKIQIDISEDMLPLASKTKTVPKHIIKEYGPDVCYKFHNCRVPSSRRKMTSRNLCIKSSSKLAYLEIHNLGHAGHSIEVI